MEKSGPNHALDARRYRSDTYASVINRDIERGNLSRLNKPVPTSFDSSHPSPICYEMLDLLTFALKSLNLNNTRTVSNFRAQWHRICAWTSFFIHHSILDGTALTPESLGFQNRLIYVSAEVASMLDVAGFTVPIHMLRVPPSPKRLHLVEATRDFIPLLVELTIHLASISHPGFEFLWSHILRLDRILDKQICDALNTLIKAPNPKYDVATVLHDILLEELRRNTDGVNVWALRCALDITTRLMFSGPVTIPRQLVSKGIIKTLTGVLERTAVFSHNANNREQQDATIDVLNDCLRGIECCISDGFAPVCDALDAGLLLAILEAWFIVYSWLEYPDDECPFRNFSVQILDTIRQLLIVPSVVRRVLKKTRNILSDRTIAIPLMYQSTTQTAVVESVELLGKEAFNMKIALDYFGKATERRLSCSNEGKCPEAIVPKSSEGSLLKYKLCSCCRVSVYCSVDCQRTHWNDVHRAQCLAPRPEEGCPFRISKLDESFIRYYVTEFEIQDHKELVKDSHDLNLSGQETDLLVHQFHFSMDPADEKYNAIDYHELLKEFSTCPECNWIKEKTIKERAELDEAREGLVYVLYPGRKAISCMIFRVDLEVALNSTGVWEEAQAQKMSTKMFY
ncbi:hypothetical protein E1B28_003667 [Marasmius oreades]|uniref:MYND-type domain-containing protein n=1 Tax=Marasmius oreades TaxID=181124 RepID=A0A9P7UX41_9AGAR|nr:uncharacterized protein E1B28_003667 [Marasmius oreades]KAG7096215.1 hypothetical protein E1B28_003667 [Marasmius oreades]